MAQQDVMVSFKNDQVQQFLSSEEIMERCPLAYATTPTSEVSSKYVLANTATVIEDMAKLGWGVVEAKQRKAVLKSSGRFSFHMVVFQNPDLKITKVVEGGDEEVECYPRIILTNSHDGFNSFRFMVGLYRLVCSNGLVIASDQFADLKIRHINYTFEELRNLIDTVLKELPKQIDVMTEMKNICLSEDQKRKFATEVYGIRKGIKPEDLEIFQIDEQTYSELVEAVREEDKSNDLWTVFNVLQEKVTQGGFKATNSKGKSRSVKRVKSFVRDLNINKKIFEIALNYLPKKVEFVEPLDEDEDEDELVVRSRLDNM